MNKLQLQKLKKIIKEEYKKVLNEAPDKNSESDITPKMGSYDRIRTDKELMVKQLAFLKTKLSPEGYEIVRTFMAGATGLNRTWILNDLALLFGHPVTVKQNKARYKELMRTGISISNLRSYSNSSLYGLADTGDLVQQGRKYFPKTGMDKSTVMSNEDLKTKLINVIELLNSIEDEKPEKFRGWKPFVDDLNNWKNSL